MGGFFDAHHIPNHIRMRQVGGCSTRYIAGAIDGSRAGIADAPIS